MVHAPHGLAAVAQATCQQPPGLADVPAAAATGVQLTRHAWQQQQHGLIVQTEYVQQLSVDELLLLSAVMLLAATIVPQPCKRQADPTTQEAVIRSITV